MEPGYQESPGSIRPSQRLTVGWLTMFVIGSDLFVLSPLLPLIAADFTSSAAVTGLSVTLFSVTYMLSAPFLGQLGDRIGHGRVLTYSLCAFGLANLLTAAAGNLTWLLGMRVFAGAAAAGVSPSVYALVGGGAPSNRRATWLSIVVSGLLMSLAFGASFGGLIGAAFGWPTVFAAIGSLSLLLVWANNRVWRKDDNANVPAPPPWPLSAAAVALRLAPTVVWSTAVYAMYTYLGSGLIVSGAGPPPCVGRRRWGDAALFY
jgi:predicted MFS family arabinose efflux permease